MDIVVIDPGHGGDGNNTSYGAVANGLVEKVLNLVVSRRIKYELEKGWICKVVLTRDGDYDPTFAQRAAVARRHNAKLLVSVHFNGFHIATTNGFETFIYNGSLRPATEEYQRIIHRSIYGYLSGLGIVNRGKKRANFAILRLPPCSCVLIEYLFITNPREANIAKNPEHLRRMAVVTAEGIAEALNLPKKEAEEKPSGYRVVVAASDNLDQARESLKEFQRLFPTHIPFIVYNEVDGDRWYRTVLREVDRYDQAVTVRDAVISRGKQAWIIDQWEDLDFEEPDPKPEPEKPEDIEDDDEKSKYRLFLEDLAVKIESLLES